MARPPATTRLAVDRIACDGYGMCAELLPELIDLDDWGYPILSSDAVPPRLIDEARRAVAVCPVLAIRLVTTVSREVVERPTAGPVHRRSGHGIRAGSPNGVRPVGRG